MGDVAADILCGLSLTDEEGKEYSKVKEASDVHFTGRQNIAYERVKI